MAESYNEARFAADLRNPAGWLLHVRADTIDDFVERLNELWDPHAGKRTDLTNVSLFSFNPAIMADMAAGRSAEEAFGADLDGQAADAYDALAQGAKRQPIGTGPTSQAASGRGGGGGGAKIFTVDEVGEGNLPGFFIDKLTRNNLCPECRDEAGKFYDNTEEPGKGPVFRCANRDCKTSKGYPWGVFEPDTRSRSSRTR